MANGISEKLLAGWTEVLDRAPDYFKPIAVPLVAYLAVRKVTESAADLHPILGIVASIVAVVFAELWRRDLDLSKHPAREALTTLGVILAIAISAFSSFSYLLMTTKWATYSLRPDYPGYSVGTFGDQYFWLLVDMIPGLDVWKTLEQEQPLKPGGIWAGIPIIGFRAFVLLGVAASYKTWRDNRKQRSTE